MGFWTILQTPFGPAFARADAGHALAQLHFEPGLGVEAARSRGDVEADEPFVRLREQLHAYAAGRLARFDLKLSTGGTPFQRQVWAALLEIPTGETRTYGQIARAVGRPEAARAVGAANGANPVMLVTPCHRVIGADGSLTGFGGGLELKAAMLDFERRVAPAGPLFAVRPAGGQGT